MSIDIIARALASQAGNNANSAQSNATAASQRAGIIDLFANIGSRVIDASINLVSTGGHATAGQGAVRYACDSLATAALAASYPLLCRQSGDGRYWRALPDADGLVPLAAAGVIGFATPTYTTNQQPAIQQVIDYCYAVGAAGAACEVNKHYCAWTPTRTTTGININTDKSGVPFLINRNAASVGTFKLKGNGSTIWRRMASGADPATVGSWQTLTGTVGWRGGMFLLVGASSAPANYYARTALHLDNISLMGGIPFVSPGFNDAVNGFSKTTGQGWDITDKAVWGENDRYTGDITLTGNVLIDGFGGEHIYQGGATHGSIYQYGGTFTTSNSNGDGFNPSPTFSAEGSFTGTNGVVCGGTMRAESIRARKCYQAVEGSTGWGGRIGSLVIEDCDRANGLTAGVWIQATQPTGLAFPTLTIDRLRVERSSYFTALKGNRIGNATLIDTYLQISQSGVGSFGIDIGSIEVIADQNGISDAVVFFGTSTSGSKGTYQNHIRLLRCSQSDYAVANSKFVTNPCGYFNSLGDQNFVERITGNSTNGPFSRTPGGVTDYHVGFGDLSALTIANTSSSINIETTPALTTFDPLVTVYNSSSSGLFNYTLPAPTGKLPKGSRRRLLASTTGTSIYSLGTTNTRSDRAYLMRNGDQIELEYDGYFWRLAQPASSTRLTANASGLTWTSLANGATSAEQTVTLNGVKLAQAYAWRVWATPPSGGFAAGLVLNARISADNTVALSITNTSGGSLTPASGGITVYAEALV
jgi:hypothetical protein